MKIRTLTATGTLLALAAAILVSGCIFGGSSESSTWAALDSGKPAFYYFGAPS